MHASHARRCAALKAAVGLINDEAPSAMFMDVDQITATIKHLQHEAGFPGTLLCTCVPLVFCASLAGD